MLKDAFGLSLEEIAETLSTTIGAIKTALHRGRSKLVAPEPEEATVTPAVLDAFCEAFNARDLDRLTALLLDTTTLEYPGFKIEHGAEVIRAAPCRVRSSAARTRITGPGSPHCELRTHRGEPIFLGGQVMKCMRSCGSRCKATGSCASSTTITRPRS